MVVVLTDEEIEGFVTGGFVYVPEAFPAGGSAQRKCTMTRPSFVSSVSTRR